MMRTHWRERSLKRPRRSMHSLALICAVCCFVSFVSLPFVDGFFLHQKSPVPSAISGVRTFSRDAAALPGNSQGKEEMPGSVAGESPTKTSPTPLRAPTVEWEVFVDQSKASLDKGGSATLDAFLGLAPADKVHVVPAVFKSKSKGPVVRCLSHNAKFDVGSVDSVDKVFRILTKHMRVQGVSSNTVDCLKWKYKGNGHLEAGKVNEAVDAYDKALACGVDDQEGMILLMRATAYLRRAENHRAALSETVSELTDMVPEQEQTTMLFQEVAREPALANPIFRRILSDTAAQEKQFRRTQYRHGLYQYALLQAAQDSLRATELLPGYATSWLRAADILSELWKLKESAEYYRKAMELDSQLRLSSVIDRLHTRQELLDRARAYGWSEDTLRLALDVAR